MARPISEIALTETLHYEETINGKTQTVAYWPIRKDADGVVLLRENVLDEQRKMNATAEATYIDNLMDSWLNDETAGYLSYFDEKMRACIIPSSIKIKPYNSDAVTEIARRAYLLSLSEVTNGGVEGESILPMLKVHSGQTGDSGARIAYNSTGNKAFWWLLSAYSAKQFWFVTDEGYTVAIDAPNMYAPRPVFKVSNATLVSDSTADTIYILPDASKPYRELSFTAFLGGAAKRPKRAKVQVSITGASAQSIQISNNAKDANPAWVACGVDQVVELPNAEKTTDLWELGVKISAQGEGRVTCGEPVAIVGDQIGTGGGGTTYVVGAPVSFTLTGWDPDTQGTTYKLKAEGYKIGAGGVQLGLPSDSSTVNTQAVVAAALTIVNTAVTAPDKNKNIAGYTEITISAVTAPSRDLTVAIFGLVEAERVTVTEPAIGGVTAPVAGEYPVYGIEGKQFTGEIIWKPKLNDSKFGPQTTYTATITLTPKVGYTLDGVATNFFTVEGATTVSNAANSGVVTAVFPKTGTAVVWNPFITVSTPATGYTPNSTVDNPNYTGKVVWSPEASTFAASTVYTATVTLTPKEGFTFDGIPENFFYCYGATSVTNAANSGVVTIVFPATKEAKS